MLLEFSVRNFLSVHERQALSFLPAGRNRHRVDTGTSYEPWALPVVGVFGANGAGKSNLFSALRYFCDAVRASSRLDVGERIPTNLFAFSKDFPAGTTEMELTFVLGASIWRYGWEMDAKRVLREWLFKRAKGAAEKRAYDRAGDTFKIAPWVRGEKSTVKRTTLPNQLFLSKIGENFVGDNELSSVYRYISRSILVVNKTSDREFGFYTSQRCMLDGNAKILKVFLNTVGVDVDDVRVEEVERGAARDTRRSTYWDTTDQEGEAYEVHFVRDAENDVEIGIGIEDESSGNRLLFHIAGPILDALHRGTVLVIDEIDNSLHTAVLRTIIEFWYNRRLNENRSQLLFSAHDTSVMNEGVLERDQIFLVEKSRHASIVYSLADFVAQDTTRPRRVEAFGRQYLSGKFGAMPQFEPSELLQVFKAN